MRKLGIDVLLDLQHLARFPLRAAIEKRANRGRAMRRREISIHGVRIVRWKRILIRRDQLSSWRIEEVRQFVERNEAVPFAFAGRAIGRQIAAAVSPANRVVAGGVISDISRGVGVDKILTRPRKARDRGGKFLPIVSPVDIEKWKLERSRVRRGPPQRIL